MSIRDMHFADALWHGIPGMEETGLLNVGRASDESIALMISLAPRLGDKLHPYCLAVTKAEALRREALGA